MPLKSRSGDFYRHQGTSVKRERLRSASVDRACRRYLRPGISPELDIDCSDIDHFQSSNPSLCNSPFCPLDLFSTDPHRVARGLQVCSPLLLMMLV